MPDSEHNQDSQKGPKILITIEGWGVNLVGAYGNALVPTPHLDQLASRSTLFDQFWVHSTQKHSVLRSISKAMDPDNWLLVTDDPIAAQIAVQCRPQLDVLEVSKAEGNDAFDWLVTQALELWIQNKYESQNLWIHSLGLAGEWDAPYEHRKVMCTSDDPDPPVDIVPPEIGRAHV